MEKQQDCEMEQAEADVGKAKAEVQHALAELEHAEHDLEKAEAELEEAHKPRIVEVTVDRQRKCVEAGVYVVSAFKALVGVAADRELDILKDGVFHPLDDDAKITIHGCETFVSHARTGGSS
jgi:hypothetical protein